MDLVLDLLQGAGVAAAIGIRPFLPVLLAGALASANVGLDFDGTDFAFLEDWPFLLAVVIAVTALDYLGRRGGAAARLRLPLVLGALAVVLGALEAGGSVADRGNPLVIGILVGATIAAKGTGEFRVRMPDAVTAVRSIIGGALMGIGATLAGGCTIGNAMVNSATFGLVGWVSLIFMILGTGAATRVFIIGSAQGKASATTALTYVSANH